MAKEIGGRGRGPRSGGPGGKGPGGGKQTPRQPSYMKKGGSSGRTSAGRGASKGMERGRSVSVNRGIDLGWPDASKKSGTAGRNAPSAPGKERFTRVNKPAFNENPRRQEPRRQERRPESSQRPSRPERPPVHAEYRPETPRFEHETHRFEHETPEDKVAGINPVLELLRS